MTEFLDAGVHLNLPERVYHADPAPLPSLNSSVAKLLIDRTPAHAKDAHPRLNPEFEHDDDRKFDVGKAAHALVCGGDQAIQEIPVKDYRAAAAKRARDDAIEANRLPVTRPQMATVQAMVDALKTQCAEICERDQTIPMPFQDGHGEVTMIWQERGGVYCRARADYLVGMDNPDHAVIFDYKTTDQSASPDLWDGTCYGLGFDIQNGLYRRGAKACGYGTKLDAGPDFVFVVQETAPPYLVSMIRLNPAAIELADQKTEYAIQRWRHCLDNDAWPGHPAAVVDIEPRSYNAAAFERQVIRQNDAGGSANMLARLTGWQGPEHDWSADDD